MSTLSQHARAKAKSKLERLVRVDPGVRLDASGYKPDGPMNAGAKTGMRPISRRQYRRGGAVAGESCGPRADRKPRKAGGGALTANALINGDQKSANQSRPGDKFVGGMKRGGAINDGTRPTGGRLARKHGGRAKKGMNVNIVIAPQGGGAAAAPPIHPPMAAPPGPIGMRQGVAPPPVGPAPAMQPPPPSGMPMRAAGGRTKAVKPGAYPIDAGSGSGLGRLEKARAA